MPFYAFRFDMLNSIFQRGKIADNDTVAFSVFVNQISRGGIAGLFIGMGSGDSVAAVEVPVDTATGAGVGNRIINPNPGWSSWIIGPLLIQPGDQVIVNYTGMNISTTDFDRESDAQGKFELQLLDTVIASVAGAAVAGLEGAASAIGGAILTWVKGVFPDFLGSLLSITGGLTPDCDGLVFTDSISFIGSGLANLTYGVPTIYADINSSLPHATECSFTKQYDDSATHDSNNCGHIAETNVTYTILKVASLSAKYYLGRIFPGRDLDKGIRQLTTAGKKTSLLELMTAIP